MNQIEANWAHNYNDDCHPNFFDNLSLSRHRWYDFKEGFSSSFVKRAIMDSCKKHKHPLSILDPFAGSGTTPLTALESNCNATAIEVNPFMSFIGKTKCLPQRHSKEHLTCELQEVLETKPYEMDSPLETISTFSSAKKNDKWLFNKSVLRGFEALHHHIVKINAEDIRMFFLLALCSSAMQCCNAKKDGKCLRYKKSWQNLNYSSQTLRQYFEASCKMMIDDIEQTPLRDGKCFFVNEDCRTAIKDFDDETFDLIVFSPPYLNSFDYSDIYRPELFLAKYVQDNAGLREIRKKTLRSHVQYNWENHQTPESAWVNSVVSKISDASKKLWNLHIPQVIGSYFYDMEKILSETYRTAKQNSHLWFVVSTSAYADVEVPVDLILADIASKQGWRLNTVNALRKIRSSSQSSSNIQLRESLVICQK